MKIHHKRYESSTKSHILSLTPETSDDIYTLYNLIDISDRLESFTSRKIEIKPSVKTRISMKMCIRIESIDVDLQSSLLFAKGRVLSTHDHVPIGSYHTIEVSLNQHTIIYKQNISQLTEKSLKSSDEQNAILFIIMKMKEFNIAVATHNAIHYKGKVEYKARNYKSMLPKLTPAILNDYKIVVIASCYDTRTDFRKFLATNKEIKKYEKMIVDIKIENDNLGIERLVGKILEGRENQMLFTGIQFCQEIKVADMFLRMHNETSLTCVGYEQVETSLQYGALKQLLITNTKFKSFNVEERKNIERLCDEVAKRKIGVAIIPAKHMQGEMLNEMGGIGGILKYNCFEQN